MELVIFIRLTTPRDSTYLKTLISRKNTILTHIKEYKYLNPGGKIGLMSVSVYRCGTKPTLGAILAQLQKVTWQDAISGTNDGTEDQYWSFTRICSCLQSARYQANGRRNTACDTGIASQTLIQQQTITT